MKANQMNGKMFIIASLMLGAIITAHVVQEQRINHLLNANIEALTEDDEPGGGSGGGLRGTHAELCGFTYVAWNGRLVTCNNIVIACDYIHSNGCKPVPCSSSHY